MGFAAIWQWSRRSGPDSWDDSAVIRCKIVTRMRPNPTNTFSSLPGYRRLGRVVAIAVLAAGLPWLAQASDILPEVDPRIAERRQMVDSQLRSRGIVDSGVLNAMQEVPRHKFLPREIDPRAYEDVALPIGQNQSIPQPYLVALTASLMDLERDHRVLEIGTGSGYQAAILGSIAAEVYSIEIVPELAAQARGLLSRMGFDNVEVRTGDGYQGWPDEAPFDRILVSAAPRSIPQPLIDQLKVGGKLVIPVGGYLQDLLVVTKTENGIRKRRVDIVRVDPMTERPRRRR